MDLKLFAQALLGQNVDQELAGSNPYKPFESIFDSVSQRLIQGAAKGEDSTKNLIISGLLSGMGGGLFSNLSDDYGDTQRGRLLSAAQDIYAGKDVERPTGIPSSVFNQLKTNAALGQLSSLEADKEAKKDLVKLVQQESIKGQFANPYAADRIAAISNQMLGLGGKEPVASTASAAAPSGAPSMGLPTSGVKSADYYMSQAQGIPAMANALMQKDLDSLKEKRAAENIYRDEFDTKAADYTKTLKLYGALEGIADEPGAIADLPFITGLVKAGDPGGTVQQGEAGLVINSSSLPDQLVGTMNKYFQGTGNLAKRGEVLAIIENYLDSQKAQVDSFAEKYTKLAKMDDLRPEAIVMLPELSTKRDIKKLLADEARAQGVDPDLVLKMAKQESDFRQGAVSKKGAQGIMQLMPETAKDLGVDPTDPRQNIKGGVTYFNQMLKKYGNIPDALGAYNFGPGNYDKYLAGQLELPTETKDYIEKISGKKVGLGGGITPQDALILETLSKRGA